MAKISFLFAFSLLAGGLFSESVTNQVTGQVFEDAKLLRIEIDGLVYMHSSGVVKLGYYALTEEQRDRYCVSNCRPKEAQSISQSPYLCSPVPVKLAPSPAVVKVEPVKASSCVNSSAIVVVVQPDTRTSRQKTEDCLSRMAGRAEVQKKVVRGFGESTADFERRKQKILENDWRR